MKRLAIIAVLLCFGIIAGGQERTDTLQASRITDTFDKDRNTTQTGLMKIDSGKFTRGYAFLSSPDVIKTLQMLPGVASGTELM